MKRAVTSAPVDGPFALGALSASDGVPYPAPVTPDERARHLREAFGAPGLTTRSLLEQWADAAPRRQHVIARVAEAAQ
ncbi:hypothetical protein [Streptomyces rishiriensis]|uniref:Uncharacterized protein n=1 Tax=Streptomyces rishiriensis TaxID=68264 RepID=A0ABU0NFY7_STRRH|nr:hypothetical protein [Streptomyces rishiriensis]MDQ0578015.1 hypothetical protein [Streptomyces rishiriensis]